MELKARSLPLKNFLIAGGTAMAMLAAVFALRFVPFDNDISVMLPRDEEITKTFRFFREAPFTANVFVSFELKEGSRQDLIRAVDQFAGSIHSPMITRVLKGGDAEQSMEDMREFFRLAPQLMGEYRLKKLDLKLNSQFVREKFKRLFRLSLNPAGSFMLPIALQDPLGFHDQELQGFKTLLAGSDYDVQLLDGHLVSRDEHHALVVLETNVPVTDGLGARNLIAYLEDLRGRLPRDISADFIAGHLHAISNENVIKRDILVTVSVTSVVFLFLFIFLFKDIRALLLFITPSISVLISIPVCALMIGKLSYIIMGMGAVISGIAVDYCIHVYVAMQSGQGRKDAVREIAKPVISGALTTAGAFAVFLFSGVPGYQQLALFTVVSTVFSLGLALLVFPYFLKTSAEGVGCRQRDFLKHFPPVFDRAVVGVWALVVLACAAAVPFVHFRMDVKQYDGSERGIFQTEEKFHKIWGGNARPAMLVIEADTFDQALETGRRLQPEILSVLGDVSYASLPQVWPPEKERLENLERWNRYWDEARIQKLRDLFKSEGAAYQFSETAFDPFFQTLRLQPEEVRAFARIGLLEQIKNRFAFETKRGWQLVSYFPDDENLITAVRNKTGHEPGAFLISAKRFESLLSKRTLTEAFYLSLAIAVILPALAFLFLKNIRQVLISLIPVVSSIVCILAMLVVFKLSLNVASLIALMVVGGFSIDYGTFMIHQNEHDLKTNTYLGVTLSALTAFCGAGALLFAKHPVLFAYGTTMVCGVAAGYVSAVFVVPAVCRLAKKKKILAVLFKAA